MSTTLPHKFLPRGRASRVSRADALEARSPVRRALRRWLLARWDAARRRAEDPQRHVPYY